jgi:methionyl-tRNA formyltransferase
MNSLKIIYMGTPDFAVPTLEKLVESQHEVVAVVTVPDKPVGRGQKVAQSAVKKAALKHEIPVLQPVKLRDPEFNEQIAALNADLAVVVAFRMLPRMVWSKPKMGTLNLHAALLPDYRGAAPLNWVLINGETETGATTFLIDEKIDTGAVLKQIRFPLPETWTAGDLHDHMMVEGAALVLDTVNDLAKGELEAIPQDHSAFIHPAPKIFKEDCLINWDQPAKKVYDFIRGMSPYPTAWTMLEGQTMKIFQTELPVSGVPEGKKPGDLVRSESGGLEVVCQDGRIPILALQLQGKKRLNTAAFLNGYKKALETFHNP